MFSKVSVGRLFVVSNCCLERKYLQVYQQENKRDFCHRQEMKVNLQDCKKSILFFMAMSISAILLFEDAEKARLETI